MSMLHRLSQTVNRNNLLRRLYNASKVLIDVTLVYLVREDLLENNRINVKPQLDPCDVVLLDSTDIKVISANPEVPQTENYLLKRLSEGCICMGIKHNDEIAAYTWCNLQECDADFMKYLLREDEAYLKDARTFSAYRGKNLAPYLRIELYKYLRSIGRTKFISFTLYFNIPAQKFKAKLRAKPSKLFLWIKFLKKYDWAIPIKNYKI